MITRRRLLEASAAGALVALPGCRAQSPPIDASDWASVDSGPPPDWAGLATSLPDEHEYEAEVEGRVPPDLHGTLYRNGPGLFERGGKRKRCLLDGDGMLQAFRFDAGRVRYQNRFVRTSKFLEEEAAGEFRYASWTTQAPGGMLSNLFGSSLGNQAGVSVRPRGEALYAFDESNQPFELDPVSLETRGLSRLGWPEGRTLYSAHPKLDGRTGEWLHFGIEYGRVQTLHLTAFDAGTRPKWHRALPLPRYVYLHDFFVTERFIVLNLHPAEISVLRLVLGIESVAASLRWRPELGNQLLVLPRGGDAEPISLEASGQFMWHALNAFDRDGEIVADFVGYDDPADFIGPDPSLWTVMQGRVGDRQPGHVRRWVIDPNAGRVREQTLSEGPYELPTIGPRSGCHAYRHAYLARGRNTEVFWSEVVRLDVETGREEVFDFGPGVYCGEPILVEPDWVLTQCHDGTTRRSFLAVLRAERLADGPVARIRLRHHVPLSFHGEWKPA